MINDTRKPREFWIVDNTDNSGLTITDEYDHETMFGASNVFHVIEYGAYEEICKAHNAWAERYLKAVASNEDIAKERDEYRAVIERVLDAQHDDVAWTYEKLREVTAKYPKCVCGETNARNCPVHQ